MMSIVFLLFTQWLCPVCYSGRIWRRMRSTGAVKSSFCFSEAINSHTFGSLKCRAEVQRNETLIKNVICGVLNVIY